MVKITQTFLNSSELYCIALNTRSGKETQTKVVPRTKFNRRVVTFYRLKW